MERDARGSDVGGVMGNGGDGRPGVRVSDVNHRPHHLD